MKGCKLRSAVLSVLALLGVAGLLIIHGCGDSNFGPIDSGSNRSAQLTQDHVLDGGTCSPTGAHAKHKAAGYDCNVCHYSAGALQFDPDGPAVAPGKPLPTFDATTKTCSNIYCHGMYEGTFTYTLYDYDCDCLVQKTVPYKGNGGSTVSWYATGSAGCGACHGNPPTYNGVAYAWHSGAHANPTIPGANDCGLCHEDAVSNPPGSGASGAGINQTSTCGGSRPNHGTQPCPPFHRNVAVDVTPKWGNCGPCH